MRRSKRHGNHFLTDDLRNMDAIVRFYMLKILVPLECHRELIQDSNYYSDEIAAVFNLPFVIEEGEFDALKARQICPCRNQNKHPKTYRPKVA